jgi:YHS domain-containing protein
MRHKYGMRIIQVRSALLISAAVVQALALSAQTQSLVDPVNSNENIAIKGYDPVAYFKLSAPVKGSSHFAHQWMGATWQFSSAENRDLFAANPVQYAPQYGGYCAYAVSEGHTASIDPEAWKIVDGKLYLNYSKGVQKKWLGDITGRVQRGDKNWPTLHK